MGEWGVGVGSRGGAGRGTVQPQSKCRRGGGVVSLSVLVRNCCGSTHNEVHHFYCKTNNHSKKNQKNKTARVMRLYSLEISLRMTSSVRLTLQSTEI